MRTLCNVMAALAVAGLICSGCGSKDETAQAPDQPKAPKRTIDESVTAAITFLKANQNEDGSFGKERPGVGITALALYGVATSRHVKDPDVQQMIDKAVGYMLPYQREDGSINNDVKMLAMYRTSLSIMVLNAIDAEKYKDAIERAQEYLKSSQFSEALGNLTPKDWAYGGWRYSREVEGAPDPDLSNVQFVITALKESGLSEDDPAFERAITFLQRCQNRTESNDMPTSANDGGAFYAPRKSKAGTVTLPDGTEVYKSYGSMTYALLKSYLFCGLPADDARVQAAYKWITENYSVDENPGVGQEGLFYYYLGMARALTALGEDTIKTPDGRVHNWREELSAKIISIQKDDGSWTNPSDRWMEGDPALVCGYAVTVLNHCDPQ